VSEQSRILSLVNTFFDMILNIFCKSNSGANLEQQLELCHILTLHYSFVLVADALRNKRGCQNSCQKYLTCLRNWVMITQEAMVIAEELLQIQLEDNRCWRTGCPNCSIPGHFAGLLVAQVQVSAAIKARGHFHCRVSTVMLSLLFWDLFYSL